MQAANAKFTATVTPTAAALAEKASTPLMHCTELYSGMQYQPSCACTSPNMEVTPTSMLTIISGITSMEASFTVLAKAESTAIMPVRSSTVEAITANSAA